MLDLLEDPLIDAGAPRSLPGTLAAMARGEVAAFDALRPHQRAAWHMFLVQLSALALWRAGQGALPEDEETWRGLLLDLTGGDAAPWHLIAEGDGAAFMQPADPGGLKWVPVATPDDLDVLITSKNHDVKQGLIRDARPQDWLFALVSAQTSEGYGGRGNFGIARMNGGSSSRPMLGFVPGGGQGGWPDPSVWWRRDVGRLLDLRAGGDAGVGTIGGPALLWLEPWAEGAQLHFTALDPWFIEVCRRFRLEDAGGAIAARRAVSKATRVDAKAANGVLGDPWAPITVKEPRKCLTLGEGRFDYRRMSALLFGQDWRRPPLAVPQAGEGAGLIVAEALARGNSKTDGWQSRVIPVPAAAVRRLLDVATAGAAEQMLAEVKHFDEAIRNALAVMAGDGLWDKVGKDEYARSRPARDAFDGRVDGAFFAALWARIGGDAEAARRDWLRDLDAMARDELEAAMPAIPVAAQFRFRARERGWRAYRAKLRKEGFDRIIRESADE